MTGLQNYFFSDSVAWFEFGRSLIDSCHAISFVTSFVFFYRCRYYPLDCILTWVFEFWRSNHLWNWLISLLYVYRDSYLLLTAWYTYNCVKRTVFVNFSSFGANIFIMRRFRSLVINFITIIILISLKLLSRLKLYSSRLDNNFFVLKFLV